VLSPDVAEGLVFAGGLILEIFAVTTLLDSEAAIPRIQSLMFSFALGIVSIGYAALSLWLPFMSVAVGVVIWSLVFIYRPTTGNYLGVESILSSDNE
jgi:hypothetical protein